MSEPCTVLIAAPDLLPALKEQVDDAPGEVLSFSDTDALKALSVITKRQPAVVALEKMFAGTPRGTALINRIKADPALAHSDIRIIAHDTPAGAPGERRPDPDAAPTGAVPAAAARPAAAATASAAATVEPPTAAVAPAPAAAAKAAAPAAAPGAAPTPEGQPLLDKTGTRRAPRFKIAGQVEVMLDGKGAVLVDLSTCGAQVISPAILRPNQRVRMALSDEAGTIRLSATVAWASFEIPPKMGPRYRAGINFIDADPAAVDAYCNRHKA